MKKAIAYYRVSTDKQGLRGLGMGSQQDSVLRFAAQEGYTVVQVFEEVKSGTKRNRKHVLAALAACRQQQAVLLIAKLDRLARDVGFTDAVLKSPVKFVCVDMPSADKMMIQLHSVIAEHERDEISKRTKAALAEAKRRGTVLGNPVSWERANKRALDLRDKIDDARVCGARSARDIGQMLGMHTTQVQRVLIRLRELQK
jgi:DNA invertase Pin-like site-specific DNA recombinase